MPERDYPVGHPAASDYKGEHYTPARAPWSEDYAADHPARAGANIDEASTPDGMRKLILQQHAENVERTRVMQLDNSAEE